MSERFRYQQAVSLRLDATVLELARQAPAKPVDLRESKNCCWKWSPGGKLPGTSCQTGKRAKSIQKPQRSQSAICHLNRHLLVETALGTQYALEAGAVVAIEPDFEPEVFRALELVRAPHWRVENPRLI